MALNHFTFILSMNSCKHYKESTGYTPDVVHYKSDSSFQVTDSLTREYALINLCQQTAHIHQVSPMHMVRKIYCRSPQSSAGEKHKLLT